MTLRFGTDGVRGVANVELTPELVLALGRAAARVLPGKRFVIGRDTRQSGPLLEAAFAAGLASEGVDVERLGVVPTPAVAWVSATEDVPAAVISASHNPYGDNGVKLFAAGGVKLRDDVEEELEAELDRLLHATPTGSTNVGTISDRVGVVGDYVGFVCGTIGDLDGLHVVVDCANGAGFEAGPTALRTAGARVDVIFAEPDGCNINEGCGATHTDALQRKVIELGADCGLALDGDADRVLAVDHRGRLVDGDHVIAICARDMHRRGTLRDDSVVVTVMTNLGFRLAMEEAGITVVETNVGDRYVLEALDDGGLSIGGEQSGHVIFRELATTGDGTLTGLQLLDAVRRSSRTLADLADEAMTQLPQVLKNVRITGEAKKVVAAVGADVAAVEGDLGGHGRVLLRPSGTEPLVRVMVEAPTSEQAHAAADRLVAAVEAAAGAIS
ncbi:MAG TPA: phosphoglucosamine mutase [Acidimicrobiales bacterium]|nr:phosphoglucosamine mutase [Acidimicrobiales bacterium]